MMKFTSMLVLLFVLSFCLDAVCGSTWVDGGKTDPIEVGTPAWNSAVEDAANVSVVGSDWRGGLALTRVDSNTVTIAPGSGWCVDNWFELTSNYTHSVTSSLDLGLDVTANLNFYIDESASTFPTNLVFYDSIDFVPTNSLVGQRLRGLDRRIAAAPVVGLGSGAGMLVKSFTQISVGPWVHTYIEPRDLQKAGTLADNLNPDSTWQEPNLKNLDKLAPKGTFLASVSLVNQASSGGPVVMAAGPYLVSQIVDTDSLTGDIYFYREVYGVTFYVAGLVTVDPEDPRIVVLGLDANNSSFDAYVSSWRARL